MGETNGSCLTPPVGFTPRRCHAGDCCTDRRHLICGVEDAAGRLFTVPKPYPKEFRDDVVRVARNREPGQQLKQIAADFGISESFLTNWLKRADVEDGTAPAVTSEQAAELRELRRRNRLLEQENEVLRRAAAYLSQANLPPE